MEKVNFIEIFNFSSNRKTWQDLAKFARTKETPLITHDQENSDSESDDIESKNTSKDFPLSSYRLSEKKEEKKKKKNRVQNIKKFSPIKVSSLLEICIKVICKYIDCVEGFGLIPSQLQNSICSLLAKERKMNSNSLKLFLSSDVTDLTISNSSG